MLTFTDIFCGAGGSSIGLAAAGFELKLAANHWPVAIETHSANFRDAEHLCADVNNYDMRRLPATDVLWASPICTELSPAGGRRRKHTRGQLNLLEQGPISSAGFERTRATFWDVLRATEVHRYKAVLVENVVEAAWEWELWDVWLSGLRTLGYETQIVSVSTAHVGGPTNPWAPQWRDRMYVVATRKGTPLPDVTPRPVAWCRECDQDVEAVQSWRAGARTPGKFGQQYDYRCPHSRCRHSIVEPYVLPAASIIDWSNVGQRIGDRRRPLADSTMGRIRSGLARFAAEPTIVRACGGDGAESGYLRAWPAAGDALGTRLTSNSDGLLVPSGGSWNNTAYRVDVPMRTRTAAESEAVLTPPFLAMLRGNNRPHGVDEPLATVTTGRSHCLTVPPGAFLDVQRRNATAQHIDEPMPTVTAGGNHHALVIPYRRGTAKTTGEPLHTLATRESAALLQPAVAVEDCHYRMLQPREHLRAQRFPDSYIVTGHKGAQTMQAGNAVSANVAQWLGAAVAAVLGGAAC